MWRRIAVGKQSSLFGDHENRVEAAKAEAEALRKAVETPRAPHEPDLEQTDGYMDLRRVCDCGGKVGRIKLVSNQLTVRCEDCDAFHFNCPRAALGLPPPPPVTKEIKSQFAGACRVCGTRHPVGGTVVWTKGVKGVLCLGCKAVGAGA